MILYYSGTGNSWIIANRIGERIGEIPVSMNRRIKDGCTEQVDVNERVVFVMPVYSGRPPRIVYEHIMNTEFTGCEKAYFVGACNGRPWDSERFSKNLCRKKGWKFMGFNFLLMPQCNIMMHKMLSPEENENIIREAMTKVEQIAELISVGKPLLPDKKAFPLMTDIGAPMTDFFYQMKAKKFYVTDACIGCGKCAKICVNNNITLVDKKPVWKQNCMACVSCIQACPVAAIQYDKKTQNTGRYYQKNFKF